MREIKIKYYLQHEETGNITHFINSIQVIEATGIVIPRRMDIIDRCQYTGLKDKNGKEIYEGDILEYKYSTPKRGRVYYDNYKWKLGTFFVGYQDDPYDAFSEDFPLEVIGNIYENPELLK